MPELLNMCPPCFPAISAILGKKFNDFKLGEDGGGVFGPKSLKLQGNQDGGGCPPTGEEKETLPLFLSPSRVGQKIGEKP